MLFRSFLAAVQGLTQAQWTFKPSPTRWSVQEVAEHVVLVEEMLGGGVAKTLAGEPDPALEEKPGGYEMMRMRVLDRSFRGVQAPDPVSPKGQWTLDETVSRFRQARARSRELLSRPGLPLKARLHKAMPGTFNCYRWLTLVSLHTRRHLSQILEIKAIEAGPGYPK